MKRALSRREFCRDTFAFGAMGHIAAALPLQNRPSVPSAPRMRLPNPFMEKGKPVVVVVHGTDFPSMLKKGMEILGGFNRFGPGKGVQIKPNFVAPSPYPTTTDGDSILTTIELLKKDGFDDITIAEWGSVGLGAGETATEGFRYYGLDRKAETRGFKIKDLINDETIQVTDPKWVAMPSVGIRETVYKAPLIINMPTLKQHSQIQFSCALKNTMGQVDKQSRMHMHRQGMGYLSEGPDTRYRMPHLALAEIAAAINPDLTIVDARLGLGRAHHLNRGGITVKPGRIIISGDSVAADQVAAEVLAEFYRGFDVEMAHPQLHHASTLGLGTNTTEDIVIKETSV